MSLAGKTLNGLKWSYVFTVINVIAQLGLTVVLARILSPKDYGLIAMGNVVLRFGSYFAQMGIGQSLIQRNEIDGQNIFTAYALTLSLSLFFYMLIFLLAPLSQYLFSNPAVISIIRVLAINLVFSSVATVPISLLRINYKYRLFGIIDFIAFIIGNAGISILLASLGFGVWSLVFAVIAQGLIQVILAFYFTREYFEFCTINFESAKKLLNYGSRYTVSTFLEVITYSTDCLIIGHYFKENVLGVYNRASLLVQLPSQYISANLIKVLFPTLNEVKYEKVRFVKYFQSVNFLLGFILFGVCLFISLNAEEIITVLLGKKWVEAIPILKIIAFAVPFNLLINYNGLIYDVYGHLNRKIVIKVCHMAVMLTLCFFLKAKGLVGIAIAYLITEMLFYFVYLAISYAMLKVAIKTILKEHIPFIYIIFNVTVISFLLKFGCYYWGLSIGIKFILEMTVTPIVFLVLFFIYPPRLVKDAVSEVLPITFLNRNKYFNYLMKVKFLRRLWLINWGMTC